MQESASVPLNAQVLRDLYNNPVQAFKALVYAKNSQYYNEYFLFALKQDSSLADTLTNTQWQNLLAGQDGQIDATKLAGLLTKFTSLTECQPLKKFLNAKSLTNMESLSAEQAHSMLNMGLNDTAKAQLEGKIVAHRQQVFDQVGSCLKTRYIGRSKIGALPDQISAGSTDKNAINGGVLKSIFEDIQAQVNAGNLIVDNITTVHVNKKGKTGAKDSTEQRIAGQKAQYSYLVTGDGEIIINPKRKTTGSKQSLAKFKGSFKKVDKVVVLTLDQTGNFQLKQQVLVHQTLGENYNKKSESAAFSADVRADSPGAKAVKDDYFLADRNPLSLGDDIVKSGSYGKDKIKGLVSMTFAQVIASQARGAVMGDIKPQNVYSEDNGKPCVIFDQRARGDTESNVALTPGVSFPISRDASCLPYVNDCLTEAVQSGRDMAYVDTYGMLKTLYLATEAGKQSPLPADVEWARSEIHEIMVTMTKCMETLGDARGSMFRTDQNKEELPLLHEVLCKKMGNSKITIGDALGGPAVFDITLPNGMEKFADLGAEQIDRLPQIFTDKMIAYEFDPDQKTSVREQLASLQSEDQMQRTIGAILYERRMRNMSWMKKIMCKTRNPEYYHKDSKRILNNIKEKINLNQKGAAVSSSNATTLAAMQGKLNDLLKDMQDSSGKPHHLHGKSKQDVENHLINDVNSL